MKDALAILSAPHLATILPNGFNPIGTDTPQPKTAEQYPKSMDELGELISYTYDLTAKRAGELSIPVVGSVKGGYDRRVVVYEWTRFKPVTTDNGVELHYGFCLRFCLTVSKWDSQAKVSLPFLSAQAQIGQIQASWMMQIRGLVGSKINAVVLPPQELDVETFVLAKQSLDAGIKAIDDNSTKFVPGTLLSKVDPTQPETTYWYAAVRTYAASSLSQGRSRAETISRLGTVDSGANDVIAETYEFFGMTDPTSKPNNGAREQARTLLHGIKADH